MTTVATPRLARVSRLPLPRMTERAFVTWCNATDVWAEWVDGEVQLMNAVELDHAGFQSFLLRLVGDFTEELDLGRILSEPFQIRLPGQRRRRSPDLFFLSTPRLNLLERHQCNGAPDLVVEIVSPESQSRDRRLKFLEYQAAGVAEYWLPDPPSRTFEVYGLTKGGTYALLPTIDGAIRSAVLPGLYVRPEWVWQLTPPRVAPLVRAMVRAASKPASTLRSRTSDKRP